MKPAEFAYRRPGSVAEALDLLAAHPDAKLLAGGQSLLTLMNLRLARPSAVIDIGRLTELTRIFDDTDDLILGALVTHRTVEVDPLVAARAPLLADAARYIGHVGIRNRGTIGGSIAHADPAAEMPLATLVLGATFHVESAVSGRRQVAAEDMFVSFYTNGLESHEMLTWISVPAIRPGQGWGFAEYAPQHGDYGLAGAGCLLTLAPDGTVDAVRAAVLSAADRPLLFVGAEAVGARPTPALWRDLAHAWSARTEPAAEDIDYVRRLCAEALTEALTAATGRAAREQEAAHV
ncbi:FAD binding domain-containing protein [Mycolicibacterium litorale]|uniref:Carbon-monoxide dehydrogenase medium subunit n=1 Tax=Mycolicibacterium litorale TaxID=758802 RepID=A0AAD1MS03_9MYCO|nr:FAD binding domain-containing protein [Mycolicibacterium litorale]MCV7415514.1 FAD binding domain-containing protein [Mycolicibacterium litorale]TDY08769.1 carbon-monoxide dehydrogenase medium subunit [Mycolicibacterium litorale]BBY16694.1 carbon-monoxide dehydrogenase medium subunit [Mycolicibacterium litorale]